MKRNLYYYYGFLLLLLLSVSCKKNESGIDNILGKTKDSTALNLKGLSSSTQLRTLATSNFENHDDDSIERITVLGNQLANPYLIPNMQQAYRNLGITNVAVNVTNLYVRFKPSNVDQLDVLTTAMEAQNLELFDTPVDYDVIYEGDYYQDPSVSQEDITWQYAVVPPDFQSPSGVQYEVLAQIHIPGDDYTAVETEAERLAENSGLYPNSVKPQPNVPQCDFGYHWDFSGGGCVPNNCPVGYSWNGRACVADDPQPTGPPAPAADAGVPGGGILVYDTQYAQNPNLYNIRNRPVRKARIVARRWFKIERGFTDNNGHYQLTKRLKTRYGLTLSSEILMQKYVAYEVLGYGKCFSQSKRHWAFIAAIKAILVTFSLYIQIRVLKVTGIGLAQLRIMLCKTIGTMRRKKALANHQQS